MSESFLSGTPEDVLHVLDDEEDVTSFGILASLVQMCGQMTENGWDQPSVVYTIGRHLAPPEVEDEIGGGAMLLEMVPVAIPQVPGHMQAHMMRYVASVIRTDPDGIVATLLEGRDVIGWVHASEGWMLTGAAALAYHDEDASTRGGIKDKAERLEVRTLFASDRAGYRYMVNQIRGQGITVAVQRAEHDEDGSFIGGDIADAVADLAESLPVATP
jgi:hypothetical protein